MYLKLDPSAAFRGRGAASQRPGRVPAREIPNAAACQDLYEPSKTGDACGEKRLYTSGAPEAVPDGGESAAARLRRMAEELLTRQAKQAAGGEMPWDADKTAARIVDFAKKLAEGDPAAGAPDELRAAFADAYASLEEAWGAALPDISKATYEAAMERFGAWADETAPDETPEAENDAAEAAGADESEGESEGAGGCVAFNEEKRARQLAAAKTPNNVQTVMALLQKDLFDCEDGCRRGWCDDAEVAKVKAMIQRALQRRAEVSGADEEKPADELAFHINMLM